MLKKQGATPTPVGRLTPLPIDREYKKRSLNRPEYTVAEKKKKKTLEYAVVEKQTRNTAET